jgi:ABC-2 type transport system ATP-binding protein
MMNPIAVDVRGLCVVRGRIAVLDGLSAVVSTGSVTGLLGPSGCCATSRTSSRSPTRSTG